MKIIVAIMTLLILVMGGAAIWKLSQGPDLPPALALPATAAPWVANLPEAGPILNITSAGPYLAVLTMGKSGQQVLLFSPQTGKLMGTIKPNDN